jgi:hypothetical protein
LTGSDPIHFDSSGHLLDHHFSRPFGGDPDAFVTPNPIPGWVLAHPTADAGTYKPTSDSFPFIPEGQNTADLGGINDLTSISQVLDAILLPGTYTLRVDVGDRLEIDFAGYRIQLLAGSSLLAEDNNTLTPIQGGFVTSTASFTALNADPRLGMPLEIRLSLVNPEVRQTNFDNVRLDGRVAVVSAVPEPTSILLTGLGVLGVLFRGWINRRTV